MSSSTKSKSILSKKVKKEFLAADQNSIVNEIKKYQYAIIWRTDRVDFVLTQDIDNISRMIEVRAFSKDGELHLTKYKDKYIGRIRIDSDGDAVECYDDLCLLWGKPGIVDNHTTCLREDRGIKLNVPIVVENNRRAFLQIRSYLKNDVFEFEDYRIISIMTKEVTAND